MACKRITGEDGTYPIMMKHRILKKKAKMACKRITGEDGTYHNNLVYFYKKIVDVGYTYYVYTARPKTKGGSGTPYKYVQWLKSLTFTG